MNAKLRLTVKKNQDLTEPELTDIIALCSRTFNEDFQPYMESFMNATHVLGYLDDVLVSHALWLKRWLRVGDSSPMRTAFVEAVAVDEKYRKRGFASSVLNSLASEITTFDIAALTTKSQGFYKRLGWQAWLGPVYFQKDDGQISKLSDSTLMVISLPKTQINELNAPLTVEWRE